MKGLQRTILIALGICTFACTAWSQAYFAWRQRTHATDCTALTDGKPADLCYEQDSRVLYKCETTDGTCNTPAEWKMVIAEVSGTEVDPVFLSSEAYKFIAGDKNKLNGIEISADVTDAGNVGSSIHGSLEKETPVDADTIPAIDSADSNVLKKFTWSNIKATLKTYFDTLYNKYVLPIATDSILGGIKVGDRLTITDGVLSANVQITTGEIVLTIDGGGSAITTGEKTWVRIPYACTITAVEMTSDQSATVTVDVWKDTYANFPPTDADSITASAVPTITAGTKSLDETLTGWTTSVSAGEYLKFNVDANDNATRVVLVLKTTRI